MALVNSVSGPLDVEDLGLVYMHEHVWGLSPDLQWHWPDKALWEEERAIADAHARLLDLKRRHGVDTILEPTAPGLGRNVGAIARAAEGTGVNVIASTGWFVLEALPAFMFFKDLEQKIETLLELFMHDVEHGMDGTSIKPGAIKCVTDRAGLTLDVESVLRACARLHRATGLPITTHADAPTRRGLDQLRVFAEEGVDLRAVVIGHCNETDDMGYLEEVASSGCFLGWDRCGTPRPDAPPFDVQLATLVEMIRRGYASQIVLSQDHVLALDSAPTSVLEDFYPHWPYGYLDAEVLPGLRAAGIGDDQIATIMRDNPKAYFGRQAQREAEEKR